MHQYFSALNPGLQRIAFSENRSHAIEKLEGTYKPGMKRTAENRGEGRAGRKRARQSDDEEAQTGSSSSSSSAGVAGGGGAAPPPALPNISVPSKTLLVQGLPTNLSADALTDMLKTLFAQYAGMVAVRVVAQRGLAFIEYVNEAAAAPALQGLMNFKLDATSVLVVSYAKAY